MAKEGPIPWSVELIERVRKLDPTDDLTNRLKHLTIQDLLGSISDDPKKRAFWTNIYNGFSLKFIKERPDHLASLPRKWVHFGARKICIAGKRLSLNDIEHGLLRRSKRWWAKGYLRKCSPSDFEKSFRVKKPDPRIHFALNCGALSCPPVQPYHPDKIESELEAATIDFLNTEVRVEGREVHVTALFNMYRGDFGGKNGILRFLQKRGIIEQVRGKRLRFLPYDWTPDPNNFEQGAV